MGDNQVASDDCRVRGPMVLCIVASNAVCNVADDQRTGSITDLSADAEFAG